ncbi:hypothetical protein HN51_013562 [Arachis hypogaea]|uniref:F-box domain-containing protein n=1 Tax=Arachis hypogaea TaxID=3818 RepID=A0A445DPQ0_ARAHY|nr:F-box/kelch-repeat protein At1g23390 [Arachis hypogaea]QHO59301.1 F-box/kelch-repeat protein [Arachis hypogaea]RYR65144.1 hypothetical protein Ahy_A03g011121 [Arachis hypogaea]
MAKEKKLQEHQQENEAPIYGDILEAVLSHVPLVHLVPARHVSKAWERAVSTSLQINPIKPWLTVHVQSPRAYHVTTSHAYDPRSRAWVRIHAPPINLSSAIRSSHSTVLYAISPGRFSFSVDTLHHDWHHVHPPRVWRIDPVVASVGSKIVVAGGVCDFEDDPLAVEMYDADSGAWIRCQSMPAILKDSSASTWLSVAVTGDMVFVTEKNSGVTYSFDCGAGIWHGPYHLRPDDGVFCCVIGTLRNCLIVAGTIGDAENVKGVKLWKVNGELGFGSGEHWCEELAAMPEEMVEKLKGEDGCGAVASVTVTTVGDFVYVGNPSEPEEMVVCEVRENGGCEWWSLRNAVVEEGGRMQRVVVCGSNVGLEDLQRAVSENCGFVVKETREWIET